MSVKGLDINLLGRIEVCWNDREITLPESEAKLLALLALNRNREFKDQDLAAILYPASEAEDGGRSSVGKLKRSLCERLCSHPDQARPETQKGRQIYDDFFKEILSAACIDVARFDNLNRKPDMASKLDALRLEARGPFLQDWNDSWIVGERERLETKSALLHLDLKYALPKALADLLEQKEYETGCHLVGQVLALDPGNDPGWSHLLAEEQAKFQRALYEQRMYAKTGAQAAETAERWNPAAPFSPCPSGPSAPAQGTDQSVDQARTAALPTTRRSKSMTAGGWRIIAFVGFVVLLLLVRADGWRRDASHAVSSNAAQGRTKPDGAGSNVQLPGDRVPFNAALGETGTGMNPEAERLYAEGRKLLDERSKLNLEQALEKFQQARKLAPEQASYYTGLADTYHMRIYYGYVAPKDELQKALASAQEAMRLSRTPDEEREAHASLAFAEMLNWNWHDAEEDFLKAIEEERRRPTAAVLARANAWYSLYLLVTGNVTSLSNIQRACDLSPDSKAIKLSFGRRFYYVGAFKEAIHHFTGMLDKYRGDSLIQYWLGLCYEGSGGSSRARENLTAASKSNPDNINAQAALGHFHAMSGDTLEAKQILDTLQAQEKRNKLQPPKGAYVSPVAIAVIYMGLYDHAVTASDKALYEAPLHYYLEEGRRSHASDMLLLHLDHRFANLKKVFWFRSLMEKILPRDKSYFSPMEGQHH